VKYPARLRTTTSILRGSLFRSPVYVQLTIMPGCNLNCQMCQVVHSWEGQPQLTLSQIEDIADKLVNLGVGYVVLTGGEPFLRSDLPEIVRIFEQRGFDLRLQTNGTLSTPELADKLIEAGLRHLSVSLKSLYPEREDALAGREGVWHKIMETLSLFSERLPKDANMIVLNTVITPLTLFEAPALAEFALRAGFFISFIPIHVGCQDGDFNYRSPIQELRFQPQMHSGIDRVYKRLFELKKKGYPVFVSRRFLRESASFLKTGRTQWRCPAPNLFFAIAPDGRFAPCSEFVSEYSVLNEDFIKMYKSSAFRKKIRRQYVENCPGCMYACWPEITYMCSSPPVFFERLQQFLKLSKFHRPQFSPQELADLAAECRQFQLEPE